MPAFEPLFRNPHLQTIAGNFWKRPNVEAQFPIERRLVRTQPDVQVLVDRSARRAARAAKSSWSTDLKAPARRAICAVSPPPPCVPVLRRIAFTCAPAGAPGTYAI